MFGRRTLQSAGNHELWSCRFNTNNTSNPDGLVVSSGNASDVTVARSAAGTFTLTFAAGKRPKSLDKVWADVTGSNGDLSVRAVSYAPSTGVLTLKVYQRAFTAGSAGTVTTPAYTTGAAVATDTHTAASAGWVTYVNATTGGTTGVCTILHTGTPGTTQCTVTYSSGIPTLTFAAADAVTECAYTLVKMTTQPTLPTYTETATDTTDVEVTVVVLAAV